MIGRSNELESLKRWLEGIPPSFLIIGSSLLGSATACRKAVALIDSCKKRFSADSVHTVILIERNDEVMLEQFHSFGFQGFVFEQASYEEFEQALMALHQGAVYLPSFVAEKQSYYVGFGKFPRAALTPRETQVLQRISMGETSKEISAHLGIAVSTVDVYRKRLLTKLDVHSVAELTKYALRMELTAL